MRHRLIIAALIAMSGPAGATEAGQDCAALGLENDYLTELFCSQLQDLGAGQGTGTTRSIVPEGDPDADSPVAEWDNIGLIQDAYRADPRKTLELIERIKGVGGLTNQDAN